MADNAAKVRSPSKERELDSKIAQINLRNKAVEERQKIVQNEAKTIRPIKVIDPVSKKVDVQKPKVENKPENSRPKPENKPENSKSNGQQSSNGDKGSRAWDSGKTPATQWKTNVPELGDRQKETKSTNRRSQPPRRQNRGPLESGFQHDDRFGTESKDAKAEEKEATPDENQKPQPKGGQRNQRPGFSMTKRPIFARLTRTNQKGESLPFQKPQAPNQNQLGDRQRRPNPYRNGQQVEKNQQDNNNQEGNPKPRNRRRFLNNKIGTTNEGPNKEVNEQQKKQGPRRQRQNNQNVQGLPNETQKSNDVPKRKTPRIRPNRRNIPDHVQVRQVVRQLIGRVCMQERRENLGLPSVEKESEV